jgi:CDP-glucose 4,6-dehydratase
MEIQVHYLISGHTGFKGAWLTMLLSQRGHQVSGVALDPVPNSLFEKARVQGFLSNDIRTDIREYESLEKIIHVIQPDVVIHMAAQAQVRDSYKYPELTIETNVMGTLNMLRAVGNVKSIKTHLVVTTDKVYKNTNQLHGYSENDPLGGSDPYSTSKAMADLLIQSWVASYPGIPTAVARAGNVIGGGDTSTERLIPNLISAYSSNKIPTLRFPNSVRPWQHVLDCLNGYVMLVEDMLVSGTGGEWNFGPAESEVHSVSKVAEIIGEKYGAIESWQLDKKENPHEAELLLLNSYKAKSRLGWSDKLDFEDSVNWTTDWYKGVEAGRDPQSLTFSQIEEFEAIGKN